MSFMGYGICRIQKISGGIGGIRSHMRREHESHTNPDIDYGKSSLNYSIQCDAEHLEKRINQRISELNLKRKPRKDAVRLLDFIVTASPDNMKRFSFEQRQDFFQKSLDFLKKEYGSQNLMYCEVHLDEETPHAHIGFVPVTKDGRLCADNLMKRGRLHELQDKFYAEVSSCFGLERGEVGTKRKHVETARFKADTAKNQEEKAREYVSDILSKVDISEVNHAEIERIRGTMQYKQKLFGLLGEDRTKVEIYTKEFQALLNVAHEGVKSAVVVSEALYSAEKEKKRAEIAEQNVKRLEREKLDLKQSNELRMRNYGQELAEQYEKRIQDAENKYSSIRKDAKIWLDMPAQMKTVAADYLEFFRENYYNKAANSVCVAMLSAYRQCQNAAIVIQKSAPLLRMLDDGMDSKISKFVDFIHQLDYVSKNRNTPQMRQDSFWRMPMPQEVDLYAPVDKDAVRAICGDDGLKCLDEVLSISSKQGQRERMFSR